MSSPSAPQSIEQEVDNCCDKGSTQIGKGVNIFQTIVSILCGVVGAGMVTLPRAFSGAGWYSVFIIMLMAAMSGYTGVCLAKCSVNYRFRESLRLRINPDRKRLDSITYGDLGRESYGSTGVWLALISQLGMLVGGSAACLVLFATTTMNLIKDLIVIDTDSFLYNQKFWIIICTATTLPFAMLRTLKEMSIVILFGFFSSIFVAFAIIFCMFQYRNELYLTELLGENSVDYTGAISFESFFNAFGIFCFAYAGHSVFMEIRSAMKNPVKFSFAARAAYILCAIIYLSVTIPCFALFGSLLHDDRIPASMIENLPSGRIIAIGAKIALMTHLLVAIIFLMNPLFLFIEKRLGIEEKILRGPNELSTAASHGHIEPTSNPISNLTHLEDSQQRLKYKLHLRNWWNSVRLNYFTMVFTRWIILLILFGITVVIPKVERLQGLTGAIFTCMQCFILPCLFCNALQPSKLPLELLKVLTSEEKIALKLNNNSKELLEVLSSCNPNVDGNINPSLGNNSGHAHHNQSDNDQMHNQIFDLFHPYCHKMHSTGSNTISTGLDSSASENHPVGKTKLNVQSMLRSSNFESACATVEAAMETPNQQIQNSHATISSGDADELTESVYGADNARIAANAEASSVTPNGDWIMEPQSTIYMNYILSFIGGFLGALAFVFECKGIAQDL